MSSTSERPFTVEYFNNVSKKWVAFRECSTRPEAEMFLGHYRRAHSTHDWRIRVMSALTRSA